MASLSGSRELGGKEGETGLNGPTEIFDGACGAS